MSWGEQKAVSDSAVGPVAAGEWARGVTRDGRGGGHWRWDPQSPMDNGNITILSEGLEWLSVFLRLVLALNTFQSTLLLIALGLWHTFVCDLCSAGSLFVCLPSLSVLLSLVGFPRNLRGCLQVLYCMAWEREAGLRGRGPPDPVTGGLGAEEPPKTSNLEHEEAAGRPCWSDSTWREGTSWAPPGPMPPGPGSFQSGVAVMVVCERSALRDSPFPAPPVCRGLCSPPARHP